MCKRLKVYQLSLHKLLVLVHLVVVEKVLQELSINKQATGTEQHYKHNYYNKVLVKRKQAAAQAFGQQQALAQQQQALAQQQQSLASQAPQLFGQQISALGALGTQQQAQEQALRSADQQLAFAQQQKPLTLAQQYGQGVSRVNIWIPSTIPVLQQTPTPSPLQTALGAGATLAGVYRAFSGPN